MILFFVGLWLTLILESTTFYGSRRWTERIYRDEFVFGVLETVRLSILYFLCRILFFNFNYSIKKNLILWVLRYYILFIISNICMYAYIHVQRGKRKEGCNCNIIFLINFLNKKDKFFRLSYINIINKIYINKYYFIYNIINIYYI